MSTPKVFAVSLDSGAIIIDFNEVASEISGYSRDEVIGRNWFEIFIPEENIVTILEVFTTIFNESVFIAMQPCISVTLRIL